MNEPCEGSLPKINNRSFYNDLRIWVANLRAKGIPLGQGYPDNKSDYDKKSCLRDLRISALSFAEGITSWYGNGAEISPLIPPV